MFVDRKKDTATAAIVFFFILVFTAASIYVALEVTKNIDSLDDNADYSPIRVIKAPAKVIYKDDLISIQTQSVMKASRQEKGDYLLSWKDSAITVTPFPISESQDPLAFIGDTRNKRVSFRTFNGILYTGVPGQLTNENLYYVLRGGWLFRFTCPNMPENALETILGSVNFTNPGYFKSINVDLGNDVALETFFPENGLKSEFFTGLKRENGILDAGMFTLRMPNSWEIYSSNECMTLFDSKDSAHQMSIFTIKSVTFTQKRFISFLSSVYGGYTELKNEKIGGLEFVTSNVTNKDQTDNILVNPINRIFGLMIQSHSRDERLTETQRSIIASIRYK